MLTTFVSEAYCHGEMTGLNQRIVPMAGDTPMRETREIIIV